MLCFAGVMDDEEEGSISGIHRSWLVIDRIIAKGKAGRYLVKWQGLPYADATWEESLLPSDAVICTLLSAFSSDPASWRLRLGLCCSISSTMHQSHASLPQLSCDLTFIPDPCRTLSKRLSQWRGEVSVNV